MSRIKKEYPRRSLPVSIGDTTQNNDETLDKLLDAKFAKLEKSMLEKMKEVIDDGIKAGLMELRREFEEKYEVVNEKLKKLGNEQQGLLKTVENLKKENEDAKKEFVKLEEKLEDQVNRNLRKTLIFKNIPGDPNEQWSETGMKVAKAIAKASKNKIEESEAHDMIERAHRGRGKNKGSHIYAAILDWRDAETIKEHFATKPKSLNIFVDQMYGPRTTWRRNQALIARKELKNKKEIVSGYVAFPAKLMVKKTGSTNYILHKDYSNVPVSFDA